MKKKVTFVVPGKPFGKQRPRVIRRGRFTTTYTPKETVEYENKVRNSFLTVEGDNKLYGPIESIIIGTFPISKSTTKKKQKEIENNEELCTKKPDCDNIGKSILDALNQIAYDDDSQVVALHIFKRFGIIPRVDVELREIEQELICPVHFIDDRSISPVKFIQYNNFY